jgi:glycosyltransferase involved in cell wall biosynthesis
MRTVSSATVERMRALGQHLGISEFENTSPPTWKASLLEFLANDSHTAELRAGISFLAVNGAYPARIEFDSLRPLVAFNQSARALQRLLSNAHPARIRRGSMVASVPALTDITRFAAERSVSGIPRVVRNLILSRSGQKLGRIVWSNGRPGYVEVNPETGAVAFPAGNWSRGNRRARLGSAVVDFLQSLAGRSPRLAFALYSLSRWIPVPAVVLAVRHPEPRTCVLLHNTTIVIAEVMGRDVADRLITWQRVGLNVTTRFVVHDFLPLTHSRFFSPAASHTHLLNVEAFAASERITVATPFLDTEMRAICNAINLPAPPIEVIPLPIAITPSSGALSPKPSNPYVVFMGGFEPRKGLSEFVEYVLAHRTENDDFTAVIVGKPPMIAEKHQFFLVKRILRNRKVFRLVSGLTDTELATLMAEALAVVYVSEAEGYGLPVLESLAVGTPVITTSNDLSRHLKDLYGGVVEVFDESDAAIATIRSFTTKAHRSRVVSTINKQALPLNVDEWAERITANLLTP